MQRRHAHGPVQPERVAHRDAKDFRPLPKFHDIDAAVEHLDRLTVRYLNLFRGLSMTTTLPTGQYDWKQIFRQCVVGGTCNPWFATVIALPFNSAARWVITDIAALGNVTSPCYPRPTSRSGSW